MEEFPIDVPRDARLRFLKKYTTRAVQGRSLCDEQLRGPVL